MRFLDCSSVSSGAASSISSLGSVFAAVPFLAAGALLGEALLTAGFVPAPALLPEVLLVAALLVTVLVPGRAHDRHTHFVTIVKLAISECPRHVMTPMRTALTCSNCRLDLLVKICGLRTVMQCSCWPALVHWHGPTGR